MAIGLEKGKARQDRWKFASATLAVLGCTSTLVQVITLAYLGIGQPFNLGWSTGGAVALLGATYMGLRAEDWGKWRRKIWVWAAVTVLINLLVTVAIWFPWSAWNDSHHDEQQRADESTYVDVNLLSLGERRDNAGLRGPSFTEVGLAAAERGEGTPEEVDALMTLYLHEFLNHPSTQEAEYKSIYQALLADGFSERDILIMLDDRYYFGQISSYQACVAFEWLLDVVEGYAPLSRDELVTTCIGEIRAWYTPEADPGPAPSPTQPSQPGQPQWTIGEGGVSWGSLIGYDSFAVPEPLDPVRACVVFSAC